MPQLTSPALMVDQSRGNQDLKQRLLAYEGAYNAKSMTAVGGFEHLFATRKVGKGGAATTSGVFLFNENFGREQYKKAVKESQAAGICHAKMHVYCLLAPYSGNGIMVTKLSDVPESVYRPTATQGIKMKQFEVGSVGFSLARVAIRSGSSEKMWQMSIDETGQILDHGAFGGKTADAIEQYMRLLFERNNSDVARFRDCLDMPISERDSEVTDAGFLQAAQILTNHPGLKMTAPVAIGRIFLLTREMVAQINQMAEVGEIPPDADRPAP